MFPIFDSFHFSVSVFGGSARRPPKGWHAGPGTTPRIDLIFYNRITPAVRRQGQAPFERFMDFLTLQRGKRAPLLPVTDLEILDWVTSSSDDVKYGTVQSWLAGVKRVMVERRADVSAFDTEWFKAGLKGLKMVKGESQPRRALPLTLPLLGQLNRKVLVAEGKSELRRLTLSAAFALGFGCFLRCGEFTYTDFDPVKHLQRKDVDLSSAVPTLRLKYSKMDPTGKGRTIPIPRVENSAYKHVCPSTLLARLFDMFPAPPEAPLFSFSRHKANFPAKTVVSEFRKILMDSGIRDDPDGQVWSGHSFRRGASTWAAETGFTDNDILQLGRWAVTSARGGHQRYIQLTVAQRFRLVTRMYTTCPNPGPIRLLPFLDEEGDDMDTDGIKGSSP
jgi:integrase